MRGMLSNAILVCCFVSQDLGVTIRKQKFKKDRIVRVLFAPLIGLIKVSGTNPSMLIRDGLPVAVTVRSVWTMRRSCCWAPG